MQVQAGDAFMRKALRIALSQIVWGQVVELRRDGPHLAIPAHASISPTFVPVNKNNCEQ